MKRCPVCGSKSFISSAKIIETWIMDEEEDFVEVQDECAAVCEYPNDSNFWECRECGYTDSGSKFNVEE